MLPLFLGVGLFGFTALCTLTVKKIFHLTYNSHPLIFGCLFSSLVIAVHSVYPVFSNRVFMLGILMGLLYVVLMSLLRHLTWIEYMFGGATIPKPYRDEIIRPKLNGDIVKVAEIILQDVAAWLTSIGLFLVFHNLLLVLVTFTAIVFFLHLPGLWIFGKVYGIYFLVTSTLLAFSVPLLLPFGSIGFICLVSLHLTAYILMYILMGYFG